MRILLIEDDEIIVRSLVKALTDQRYAVDVATDGQTGWDFLESFAYDLILLDVMLPKLNGISLCQQLRSQGNHTPVLLLTAQDNGPSKVMGLDAGADDYVAKPFDIQELLARIRALLRRGSTALPPLLEWRNLRLDPSTCEVTCNNQPLHLTPKEYGLLELFLRNHHRIFSCGALIDHLWSLEEPPTEDTVRSHVKGLRQKLKAAGVADDPLETIYGIGYRLRSAGPETREVNDAGSKRGGKSARSRSSADVATQSTAQTAVQMAADTAVWQQIKDSLDRRVAVLEHAAARLLQDQLSDDLRQQAEREAHKLAGSLGMVGLEEGSRLARAIDPLLATETGLAPTQKQQLHQLVCQLRQELRQLQNASLGELLYRDSSVDERPWLLAVQVDPPFAEALAAEASARGMGLHLATTLAAARKRLSSQLPDAVLLDLPIDSPQRDGALLPDTLAFLQELSDYTPAIPAIVLTNQGSLIDRVTIADRGGRRILQKPVAAAQALEAVMQVLNHTRTAEARILVVDDDPQVLQVLQSLLHPWGMNVFTLDDPLRFLDVLAIAFPDLLVLDVEMPHIDGVQLCQVVRNDPQWSGLPILFLTAHTNAEMMQRVFTAGADDYISKPIVGPELVTRILNRLERSRLLRSLAETDALTGLANRRRSTQALQQLLQWSECHHQPFCFAIVDLDRLKAINHQYGHAAGDQVLCRLGKLLGQTFHSGDVIGRWGGTEFVIGMAGMSEADGAKRLSQILERLRQVEWVAAGRPFRVTCSAGVSEWSPERADLQALYQTADAALGRAKAAGGDRVVAYAG